MNHALKESFRISRSLFSEYMEKFITNSLYENKEKLGLLDGKLAANINKKINRIFLANEEAIELSRGIRLHFERISKVHSCQYWYAMSAGLFGKAVEARKTC